MSGSTQGAGEGSSAASGGAAEPAPWQKQMDELRESVTTLTRSLNSALTNRPPAPTQEPAAPADLDDLTLESLPRARFAEYIAEKTMRHMEKTVVKPLQQRLEQVTASTTQSQLQAAVKEAQAKYPDFMEYKDAMIGLANRHPTLNPEELYLLANPKARQADAAGKTNGGSDGAKITRVPIKFGGIKPGAGGDGEGPRNRKMSGSEAINAAWSETVAALGGEPAFEE